MESQITLTTLILIIVLSTTVTACTSSSYGNSFVPVHTNEAKNQYTLKIYTGGFAGPEFAKKDLDIAAKKFIASHEKYIDYKIISSKFELIPSGVSFIV